MDYTSQFDRTFEETQESISLHGLGFLQVKLDARQRLHVWHPGLPRRRCHEHSAIHDHRFGFTSLVLRGFQVNNVYVATGPGHVASVYGAVSALRPTHAAYLHEGPRSHKGNRPWLPAGHVLVCPAYCETVRAGDTYHMLPYVFHATRPGGDGRVATVMTKTSEGQAGARSLCELGQDPDWDFDRKQMGEDDMWAVVRDVLGG